MDRDLPPAPRTLAAALAIAIDDGRTLVDAAQGRYAFDAHRWHEAASLDAPCTVCAAGAVMAQRLGARPTDELEACQFRDGWDWVLHSINAMRSAQWEAAFAMMGMRNRAGPSVRDGPGTGMSNWVGAWDDTGKPARERFARAVTEAIENAGEDLADAWATAAAFVDAGEYRWFLDLAADHVLPIVERCEREAVALARTTP